MKKDSLYKAHKEYVTEVVKLMFFHIWDLAQRGVMPLSQGLNEVAWLYRLTTFNNGKQPLAEGLVNPQWLEMKAKLTTLMEACADPADSSSMEEECLEMLMPYLEPKFEKDSRRSESTFHCWMYGMNEDNTLASVHIVNADKPESPFADVKRFASDLLRLAEDAVNKYPTCTTIECCSWMNDMPKFLEIWPQSFKDNRENFQKTGGFGPGRWGQYVSAQGAFNFKGGNYLRENGEHRYAKSRGRCPIEDLINHLRKFTAD